MSELPKELEKLRDELAHGLANEASRNPNTSNPPNWVATDFKAGFNALFAHLTEAAGEFYFPEAMQAAHDNGHHHNGTRTLFAEGMKLQFERDAARIGLAEMSGVSKELFEMVCDERDKFEARAKDLESDIREAGLTEGLKDYYEGRDGK